MSALATPVPSVSASFLATARRHHSQGNIRQAAESYRHVLDLDPHSQPALLGLSLIARQSRQLRPALRMAQAAITAEPANAIAWANYGDLLAAIRQTIPAEVAYRRAIALDASTTAAHFGLGNLLSLQECFPAALLSFQTALELTPNLPELHFALGFAHSKLYAHRQAIVAYRRAVTLRPGFASAWLNLGVELIADGRDWLAESCYRQALATIAGNHAAQLSTRISAYLNLGHLTRGRRKFPQAREHYAAALAFAASNPLARQRIPEIHVAFAYLHLEQHQFFEATQSLHLAEQAQSAEFNPEIPNARGILLLAQHNATPNPEPYAQLIEEAIAAFRKAEALGHKTAASNRGNALLRLGRCEEALAAHQAASKLDPHHPGVRYNLALTQLRLGDFTNGWPNYEIRWSFREVHPRPRRFRQPRWQGEQLSGHPQLLIYAEQGLGDTIQFIRYLPLVAQRLLEKTDAGATGFDSEIWANFALSANPGVHLILEVQPPLTRLLQPFILHLNSVPGITAELIPQGNPLPRFTHHCPLMSLPAIFQTTLETIPPPPDLNPHIPETNAGAPSFASPRVPNDRSSSLGWLREGWTSTNPNTRQKGTPQKQSSQQPNPPLRIGLNWAGNPSYRADHERSTRLSTFLQLLKLPNIHWISLQKGEPANQISEISKKIRPHDAASSDRDLADTATTIATLDLIITTDTAIAHLAGALGKPLWLLLPWQSDWRWMQNRIDTPWYPTARLFRQSCPGNWPELIHRVAAELNGTLNFSSPRNSACPVVQRES